MNSFIYNKFKNIISKTNRYQTIGKNIESILEEKQCQESILLIVNGNNNFKYWYNFVDNLTKKLKLSYVQSDIDINIMELSDVLKQLDNSINRPYILVDNKRYLPNNVFIDPQVYDSIILNFLNLNFFKRVKFLLTGKIDI